MPSFGEILGVGLFLCLGWGACCWARGRFRQPQGLTLIKRIGTPFSWRRQGRLGLSGTGEARQVERGRPLAK